MNIHDIDLARWYLGEEVASVYAIGGSFVHPEFDAVGDADNTCALLKFGSGKWPRYPSAGRLPRARHAH